MAFITADRVLDSSTSTGTGAFVVSGTPAAGYRTFSAVMSVGDTCYYSIQGQTTSEWEVGLGTYSSANTLTRTTVYSSSNSGSAVTFSTGTKNVMLTVPASRMLQLNASGSVTPATNTYSRTSFTATANQTTFTVTYAVANIQVYLNGILLATSDYTATNGTSVVLGTGAGVGNTVDVITWI